MRRTVTLAVALLAFLACCSDDEEASEPIEVYDMPDPPARPRAVFPASDPPVGCPGASRLFRFPDGSVIEVPQVCAAAVGREPHEPPAEVTDHPYTCDEDLAPIDEELWALDAARDSSR